MLRASSSSSSSPLSIWISLLAILLIHCTVSACGGRFEKHNSTITTTTIDEPCQYQQREYHYYEAKLARVPLQGIRKMSSDPGEKFFFEYYNFVDDAEYQHRDDEEYQHRDGNSGSDNGSAIMLGCQTLARIYPPSAAFPLSDSDDEDEATFMSMPMLRFSGRSFQCPAGTNSCASINRPDRCCRVGDTCELVAQNGGGGGAVVGCCPAGQSCFGVIGSCAEGYTTCSQTLGGGCCIPGYECVQGGCE